jgi:hypothetical protein
VTAVWLRVAKLRRFPHDAQDAFQATFLMMARKAGSVHNADSLASWLHGTAFRVAAQAKADEARRRRHDRRFATMKVNERDKATVGSEPCPELHEEIARLPRRYREPVVLCNCVLPRWVAHRQCERRRSGRALERRNRPTTSSRRLPGNVFDRRGIFSGRLKPLGNGR